MGKTLKQLTINQKKVLGLMSNGYTIEIPFYGMGIVVFQLRKGREVIEVSGNTFNVLVQQDMIKLHGGHYIVTEKGKANIK